MNDKIYTSADLAAIDIAHLRAHTALDGKTMKDKGLVDRFLHPTEPFTEDNYPFGRSGIEPLFWLVNDPDLVAAGPGPITDHHLRARYNNRKAYLSALHEVALFGGVSEHTRYLIDTTAAARQHA